MAFLWGGVKEEEGIRDEKEESGIGEVYKRKEREKRRESGDTGTDRQCCAAIKPVDEGGLFYQYGELL